MRGIEEDFKRIEELGENIVGVIEKMYKEDDLESITKARKN